MNTAYYSWIVDILLHLSFFSFSFLFFFFLFELFWLNKDKFYSREIEEWTCQTADEDLKRDRVCGYVESPCQTKRRPRDKIVGQPIKGVGARERYMFRIYFHAQIGARCTLKFSMHNLTFYFLFLNPSHPHVMINIVHFRSDTKLHFSRF